MQSDQLKRREFITLLAGAAAWPHAARAQQPERMRRIDVLMAYAESDLEGQALVAAFREGLGLTPTAEKPVASAEAAEVPQEISAAFGAIAEIFGVTRKDASEPRSR